MREFVKTSFREHRANKSELNYQPTDAQLKKNIMLWKNMPAKTSYLDPVIKVAKSSLPPTAYSKHQNWADDMSNSYSNGHAKKGVF